MPAGRHSDRTPDTRRVRLCSRAVRTVQAAQPLCLLFVAASWSVVGTGELYAAVCS